MANKVVKELQINVSIKNGKLVIDNVDQLKKAIDGVHTSQQRVVKSTADVANANKNTTKSFSDQARASSGLVRSYAILAANAFALSRAYGILKRNADLTILERSAEQLSRSTGTNFAKVAKDMKAITGGALNIKDAFTAANLGLSGGATVTQLKQITEVATKAANTLGRSVPEAVNRMTQAVIKGEPELVDEFGIILRVKEAADEYALSIGKVASELSTLERQQAIINQLIEQGTRKFSDVTIEVNPYQKLETSMSELIDTMLKFISVPLGSVIGTLADNAGLLLAAIGAIGSFILKQLVPSVKTFGETFNKSLKSIETNAVKTFNTIDSKLAATNKKIDAADKKRLRKQSPAAVKKAQDQINNVLNKSNSTTLKRATAGQEGLRLIETVDDILDPAALKNAEDLIDKTTGDIVGKIVKSNSGMVNLVTKDYEALRKATQTLATDVSANTEHMSTRTTNASRNIASAFNAMSIAALNTKRVFAATSVEMIRSVTAVSSATSFGGAVTAFKAIGKNFDNVASSGTRAGKAINLVAKGASFASGGIALLGRGLASIVSTFSYWGVILLIAYEALKSVADALGFIDHEANAAEAVVDDLTDSFAELANSSDEVLASFNSTSTSLEEVVGKYSALNNKITEVTQALLDNSSALQKVSNRTFFSRFLQTVTLGYVDIADTVDTVNLMLRELSKLEELSGEPITIDLVIDGETTTLIDIQKDAELLNRTDVKMQIDTAFRREIKRVREESIETTGSIEDMGKAAKELNDISSGVVNDFKGSLPTSYEVDNLLSLQKGFDTLAESTKSSADKFISFTSGLNSYRRASLGISEAQVTQAKGIAGLEKLLGKLNKEFKTVEGQQDVLRAFILKNKENEGLQDTLTLLEKIANVDYSKQEGFFDRFTSDKTKVLNANIANKVAAALSDKKAEGADLGEGLGSALKEQLADLKSIEALEASAQSRRLTAATELEAARIQQSRGVLGSASKVVALERESLRLSSEMLRAEKKRLVINKAAAKAAGDDVRFFDLAISAKQDEIAAQEYLIAIKSQALTTESGAIKDNIDLLKTLEKEQEIISINRISHAKQYKQIEDNTYNTTERRLEALTKRLPLDLQVLDAAIREAKARKEILESQEKVADLGQNIKDKQAALLGIVKEEAKIADLKLKKEKLISDQIEQSLLFRKEEAVLLNKSLDIEKKREKLLLGIASNRKVSPTDRQISLKSAAAAQKAADKLAIDNVNTQIDLLEDKLALMTESHEKSLTALELEDLIIEKNSIINEQLGSQLERRKEINEIQKDLVDLGEGSFVDALGESLSIAAEEFSNGITDSVTVATNAVLAAVDSSVDSLVDNFDALASGDITVKEYLTTIATDTIDAVQEVLKDSIKERLKELILSPFIKDEEDKTVKSEQVDATNNILTNIDSNMGQVVELLGGVPEIAPPEKSIVGVAGIDEGFFGGILSGITDFFSSETPEASPTASTILGDESKRLAKLSEIPGPASDALGKPKASEVKEEEDSISTGFQGEASLVELVSAGVDILDSMLEILNNNIYTISLNISKLVELLGGESEEVSSISMESGSDNTKDAVGGALSGITELAGDAVGGLAGLAGDSLGGIAGLAGDSLGGIAGLVGDALGGLAGEKDTPLGEKSSDEVLDSLTMLELTKLSTTFLATMVGLLEDNLINIKDNIIQLVELLGGEAKTAEQTSVESILVATGKSIVGSGGIEEEAAAGSEAVGELAGLFGISASSADSKGKTLLEKASIRNDILGESLDVLEDILKELKKGGGGGGGGSTDSVVFVESSGDSGGLYGEVGDGTGVSAFAEGGIVSQATNALIGEAGPEAVIPLSNGSVPVQISDTTSVAAVKALVTVGTDMNFISETSSAILSELTTLHTDMNLGLNMLLDTLREGFANIDVGGGAKDGLTDTAEIVLRVIGAEKGGIFSKGIRAFAEGGVTTGPELGLIGEGENNEAIVPLPDNRNIPVVLMNEDGEPASGGRSGATVNITMNFTGGSGNNGNFNKSANQIALETARVVQRSLKRDD